MERTNIKTRILNRKKFISKGIISLGAVIASPAIIACKKQKEPEIPKSACSVSPAETDGPFPNKSPATLINENIVGDRTGIPLLIELTIQNTNNNCLPEANLIVDLWHCDAHGNYSQYNNQLEGDFTTKHFLRGRQSSDLNGKVSFLSIYPGWYPGRAPHIHVEIKNSNEESVLITQIAFPEDVSNNVYSTNYYKGTFDTSNLEDGEFEDSLNRNLPISVLGNAQDGFTLIETIKVNVT